MLIFAHRGASAIEPENTLRAFNAALLTQSDGVEFDLQQVDGELVVIHDRYLDRTTSGNGLLSQLPFEQLRQYDAGKGEVIPTLMETLTLLANKTLINIELKALSISDIPLLLSCLDRVKHHTGLKDNKVIISSFDHHLLQAVHQKRPELLLGALTVSLPITYAKFAQQLNAYSVHISVEYINQAFVQDAHHRGLKVYVYTVDRAEDIINMKKLNVDGIFSNNPQQAKIYLEQLKF